MILITISYRRMFKLSKKFSQKETMITAKTHLIDNKNYLFNKYLEFTQKYNQLSIFQKNNFLYTQKFLVQKKNVDHVINTINGHSNRDIIPAISITHGQKISYNKITVDSIKFPNTASWEIINSEEKKNVIENVKQLKLSRAFYTFITQDAIKSESKNKQLLPNVIYSTGTEKEIDNEELNNRIVLATRCDSIIKLAKEKKFNFLLQSYNKTEIITMENNNESIELIKNKIGTENYQEFILPIIQDYDLLVENNFDYLDNLEMLESFKETILENGTESLNDQGSIWVTNLVKLAINDIFDNNTDV